MAENGAALKVPFRYARMWPRELFYRRLPKKKKVTGSGKKPAESWLYKTIPLLGESGVYVLYWDNVPYYVGQAEVLRARLAAHARVPVSRYFNHWNYFSVFVADKNELDRLEAILIAAMPTANGRKPLKREPFHPEITKMVNEMHQAKANPFLGHAKEDIDEEQP